MGTIGIIGALILLSICLAAVQYQIRKILIFINSLHALLSKVEACLENIERLADLEKKILEKTKKLESPSVQLQDFIEDIAHEGCGMVRIDPGAIFIRGMRR